METSTSQGAAHAHSPHHGKLVVITVDGEEREVPAGEYRVSQLKVILNVPPEYELDQVVHGEFQPLADDANIKVKQHDVFVSHVRCGGSS